MVHQMAWIACTGALFFYSSTIASGPAGGFFLARHHPRSRQRQLPGQVQQHPRREAIISRLLGNKNGEDRLDDLGRVASTATGAVEGEKNQEQSGEEIEPTVNSLIKSNDATTPSARAAGPGQDDAIQIADVATCARVGRQWRDLPSPLVTISSTGRQVGARASATAVAWGVKNRMFMGRIRGGSSAPQEAPPTPPQQGDRWAYAIEGLKNGLASGLAAACVKTVLQPFDTMKTVQQFSTTRMTLLQAGRNLIARGGVPELYQGLGVTLIGSMPAVGVYFGLYQYVKKQMDARKDISPYISITVSAGVGNFVASVFRVPYEVVKQRLQVGQYPSTMVALQGIYRDGGLMGFFGKGGLKTQWARDIPYAMVTLLVYETLQKAAARRKGSVRSRKEAKANPFENMVIGAIAGGMGSLVTNPMDMVKTRMMTSPELYAGPMDAAWQALSKEGPQAFLKGATPRLLHKIPANAFFFVCYEFFRNILGVTR